MITYYYNPVRAHRMLRGNCPICGRSVTRSKTFEKTVNPFNRNDDGTVRTYRQVRERVEALADEWVPDFRHAKCRDEIDR